MYKQLTHTIFRRSYSVPVHLSKYLQLCRIIIPVVLAVFSLTTLLSALILLNFTPQPVYAASFDLTDQCPDKVGNVNALINAIGMANTNNEDDIIILAANCVYTLTTTGDIITNTFGHTGLPAITSTITISGNGAIILRDPGATTAFRLIYVGPTGDLTLKNLTLYYGLAQGGNGSSLGGGAAGMGGAIFNNQGHLNLEHSNLFGNIARGGDGGGSGSYGGGGGVGGNAPGLDGGGPNGGNSGSNGGFGGVRWR